MPRAVKIVVSLAAVVVAMGTLAGCTVHTAPAASDPTPTIAAAQQVASPTPTGGCADSATLSLRGTSAVLSGTLVDHGERDLAAGTPTRNSAGRIVTYTVAPGDALLAIGARFCITNPVAIAELNHSHVIHPGQVLLLEPDLSLPWVPYYNPVDAPAGYKQGAYQDAVEAMSAAAHAGDLAAMRAIFAKTLSPLLPSQADAAPIVHALKAGDLKALRQMFA
jgi:hypothetical protein